MRIYPFFFISVPALNSSASAKSIEALIGYIAPSVALSIMPVISDATTSMPIAR